MPLVPINDDNANGVVTFALLVNGTEVGGEVQVKSISIHNSINRITTADIVILDGNAALQIFEQSNSDKFIPGVEIEIEVGYNNSNAPIFKGVIISQKVSAAEASTQLHIQCKSPLYAMTLSRKSNIYYDVSDSDVFEQIIGKYNTSFQVETLSPTYSQIVQHRATDWDFMMTRAQINGCVCYEEEGFMVIEAPDTSRTPIHQLVFGENIFDLDLDMDARHQHKKYQANSWNYSDQLVEEREATPIAINDPGNISLNELADTNKESDLNLVEGGSIDSEFAGVWISAKKHWQELAKVTGTIAVQGSVAYRPAEIVGLAGVSDRFNGDHYISAVHHEIGDGNWKTHISIGVNPKWFTEQFDNVSELPASAMMPAVSGLQIGLVTALEGDPLGEQRIQVQLPLVHKDSDGVWARVLSPYAGEGIGMHFLPEIRTEVLVGFLNDDPHQAVVMGGLFSNTNTSPQEFTDDNHIKTIVTRGKTKIEIDDENNSVKIETPNGNIITANDDDGQILLEDESGNKMTMSSDGIELDSPADINIKAQGDVNIEGLNINSAAQAEFKAEGSAGIEVSSSGTAVLKGSLVQIN